MKAIVLTYHSHNIFGTDYGRNDHVSFASDLETLHSAGARVASLEAIASMVRDGVVDRAGELIVGLSFDDGPVFDVEDFVHPEHGSQRGMLGIMEDFRERHGRDAQPGLHATSFVIASPGARASMERADECGYSYLENWLGDAWWASAASSGLLGIGNHSWDHVHHLADRVPIASGIRDNFALVCTYPEADAEIRRASAYIKAKTGAKCRLFAYPYGHLNDYLPRDYFPNHLSEHEMEAAFGASGSAITRETSIWSIPRSVCGLHWHTPEEFAELLHCAGDPGRADT